MADEMSKEKTMSKEETMENGRTEHDGYMTPDGLFCRHCERHLDDEEIAAAPCED